MSYDPEPRITATYRLRCSDGAEATVTCSARTHPSVLSRVKDAIASGAGDKRMRDLANLEMSPLMTEAGLPIATTQFFMLHMAGERPKLTLLGEPRVSWTLRVDGYSPTNHEGSLDEALTVLAAHPFYR